VSLHRVGYYTLPSVQRVSTAQQDTCPMAVDGAMIGFDGAPLAGRSVVGMTSASLETTARTSKSE